MLKIYILPIGKVKIETFNRIVLQLEERFFYKFEVLNSVPLPRDSYDSTKNQYNAKLILKGVSRYKPEDTKLILGVLDVDIFTDKFNFTFSHTSLNEKIGIVSIYRLKPEFYGQKEDENLLYERTLKKIIHELGHLFGIKHCYNNACVMYSASNIFDIDKETSFLCEVCQEKLNKETKNV